METFIKALMYAGAGAVLFALVFCAVALVPAFNLDQVSASYWGAGIGAVAGFGFGRYRRFA